MATILFTRTISGLTFFSSISTNYKLCYSSKLVWHGIRRCAPASKTHEHLICGPVAAEELLSSAPNPLITSLNRAQGLLPWVTTLADEIRVPRPVVEHHSRKSLLLWPSHSPTAAPALTSVVVCRSSHCHRHLHTPELSE